MLGPIAALPAIAHEAVLIAIGDNHTRRQLFDHLEQLGERFIIARHPAAVIAPDLKVGPATLTSPIASPPPECLAAS